MRLARRDFLIGSAALAAGASVTTPFSLSKYHLDRRSKRSRIAVLRAQQYDQHLGRIVDEGLRLFPVNVRDKTVMLKPNLVDYLPGNAVNTHPMLVLAAAEAFRRLGAKSVAVAEGPGHQRDTQLVPSQSGYQDSLREEKIRFVDLNRDELIRTPLRASYTGMKELWLPRNGTWKFSLSDAQFPKKPDAFRCKTACITAKTCVPPIDVKADGQDQPVSGNPYYDRWDEKVDPRSRIALSYQ